MTYYEILEISEKASSEVIRMAYKALCKKYHPDVYQGDKHYAEEQMKKINEAYETLSDETKKRQYDYTLNRQAYRSQGTYQAPHYSYTDPKTESNASNNTEKRAEGSPPKEETFVEYESFNIKPYFTIIAIILILTIFIITIVSPLSNKNSEHESTYNDFYYIDSNEDDTIDGITNEASTNANIVSNPSSIPSTSKPSVSSKPITSNKPSSNTTTSSEPTSSKPAIFGSSNICILSEGDFEYRLTYTPNSPVDVTISGYQGTSRNLNIPSMVKGCAVTSIVRYVFEGNTLLNSVTIPSTVTTIGDYAFQDCSSLTNITIPNSVTYLGEFAFNYCSSLTSVTIPNNVTSIRRHTFSNCSSLASVIIPDSITSIGDYAFYKCSSLTNITIPNSITCIGEFAFGYCSSLTSVTIPNGVKSISIYAFAHCSALTSVTIPDSVTSIGPFAFVYCSSLKTVYFQSVSQKNKFAEVFDSNVELVVLE